MLPPHVLTDAVLPADREARLLAPHSTYNIQRQSSANSIPAGKASQPLPPVNQVLKRQLPQQQPPQESLRPQPSNFHSTGQGASDQRQPPHHTSAPSSNYQSGVSTGQSKTLKNIQNVLQNAQSMVDNLQRKKHQERDRPQSDQTQDQEPSMTNLARYKQKLREQNKNYGAGPKATVQETVNRLQEQSRLHGGTYGTNQFSSLTHTDKEKETFDDDSD